MVTCKSCLQRLALPGRASDRYEVGNSARDEMGHAMYFASDGRTALCIARERQEVQRT